MPRWAGRHISDGGNNDSELALLFLESSRKTLLGEYWPRLQECVAPLTEEQVWWRPNDASNSIGNLCCI